MGVERRVRKTDSMKLLFLDRFTSEGEIDTSCLVSEGVLRHLSLNVERKKYFAGDFGCGFPVVGATSRIKRRRIASKGPKKSKTDFDSTRLD